MSTSKIPRPQVPPVFWHKETPKRNETRGKTKNFPSMIPRPSSLIRGRIEKFQFDEFSKAEHLKKQSPKSPEDPEKENLNIKSFHTLKEKGSDSLYKDAEEDLLSCLRPSRVELKKDQVINSETKKEKQDKFIQNFYESIKYMVGPLLDKINFMGLGKNSLVEVGQVNSTTTQVIEGIESTTESVPDFSAIQGQYEFTLKEISNVWKNAISLIGSVKDHTLKFVEENDKSFDKEQLTLEAEMLQLAIDFAISFSKLKMDLLIKSTKKHLGIKGLEKTELEKFLDSKTFPNLYNNDDLTAMARTVQDLNISVSKGEELVLE